MAQHWEPDDIGAGFEKLNLPLDQDDEGEVVATLVRYRHATPPHDPPQAVRTVLYLHGWSDYFFQVATAEFFAEIGIRFYALDLRKYGRSLRPHQTPGYVDDLSVYDEEIEAAFAAIRVDLGGESLSPEFGIFAHSTGGLTAALWADRHPGRLRALLLNSAWLEVQGSYMVRDAALPLFEQIARRHPLSAIPNVDLGFNYRTVSAESEGEWHYNEQWRPPVCFPVRAGWLRAVLAGHTAVAEGLAIDAPILSMTSMRSMVQPRWSDEMHRADVVLEAPVVAERSVTLAPTVTVARFDGGLHDLVLSARPVRERVYAEMRDWIDKNWPPPAQIVSQVDSIETQRRGLANRLSAARRALLT